MLLNEHFVDNNRNGDRELRLSMCLPRASDPAALAAAEAAPAARPRLVRLLSVPRLRPVTAPGAFALGPVLYVCRRRDAGHRGGDRAGQPPDS